MAKLRNAKAWVVAACLGASLSVPTIVHAQGLLQRVAALEAAVAALNFGIVRGTVHGSGTSSGDGWTAVAHGDGTYTVTFTTPFSTPPTVTLAIHGSRNQSTHVISIDDTAGPSGITTTGFDVYLSEGVVYSATIANPWEFIAIGPK